MTRTTKKPTANFNPGDVLYAAFPYVEKALVRLRPVVVLSPAAFNQQTETMVCAMITRALNSQWPLDLPLKDYTACGLPQPSTLRFKLVTLPKDAIVKKLGHLSKADHKRLQAALKKFFAF